MKLNKINSLKYILIFSLLSFSCNKEDTTPEQCSPVTEPEVVTQNFDLSFSPQGGRSSNFIVLSNDNGEILYDTSFVDMDLEISLQIDTSTIVNATVGWVASEVGACSIVSYTDVKSGSQVNFLEEWERDPCFQSGAIHVNSKRAFLSITDLDEFYETINPMRNAIPPPLELQDNTLSLSGVIPGTLSGSHQIAVREQENSAIKSILISEEDWGWDNGSDTVSYTVSFNDFSATNEYEIELNRSGQWSSQIKVCDIDGNIIATQDNRYGSTSDLEEVENIKVYLNQDIDISKIKFSLERHNYVAPGHSYNWIHEEIPDKIDFEVNTDPTFTLLDNNKFNILNTFAYNLNVAKYQFNWNCHWSIISKGGVNVGFVKPDLPSQLYDKFPNFEERLQNPSQLINTMFRTGEVIDDITKVHKSVIPSNYYRNKLPDFNYSAKETIIGL